MLAQIGVYIFSLVCFHFQFSCERVLFSFTWEAAVRASLCWELSVLHCICFTLIGSLQTVQTIMYIEYTASVMCTQPYSVVISFCSPSLALPLSISISLYVFLFPANNILWTFCFSRMCVRVFCCTKSFYCCVFLFIVVFFLLGVAWFCTRAFLHSVQNAGRSNMYTQQQ